MTDLPIPREGMMAGVRNRRALISAVEPCDTPDQKRLHLVDVEYTDGLGAETERLLWELEPGATLVEPTALPQVHSAPPMDCREFESLVRTSRWSALTPSLPFSGLTEDRPPLAAPLFGAIQPEAYQLVPVLRALEMPRVALMLADAVGLGKTIQAGMIIRELMLRRRVRRILILCPASLKSQWREEMRDKFALPFEGVDRPGTLHLQRELGQDANPWRVHERAVASYHYLKQPDVMEQFRIAAEPGPDGRLRWDLLVVDEAHNLAPASFGQDSDLASMLRTVSPWFEHRLFLTATPHNGHTRAFSGLLEALDPVRFTQKHELTPEDRARVADTVIRRLKSNINGAHVALGQAPRFSERKVEALPVLRFGAQERALLGAFADFKRALKTAAAKASHQDRTAASFALEVLQKRLLSGPWAFGQSWLTLMAALQDSGGAVATMDRAQAAMEDDWDDDAERESRVRQSARSAGQWLKPWARLLQGEFKGISGVVGELGVTLVDRSADAQNDAVTAAANKVRQDARFKALEALLDEKVRNGAAWKPDERVVVFTEYLATLDYLKARLRKRYGEGPWLLSLFGGMPERDRDVIKATFNDHASEARVLLATDAAGEGLNLQRASRFLLHWDIPWNPGKMEQRNGRLDRHGQERNVFIFHFDSTDDASMGFLAKVLQKRNNTREDRIITDDIFAQALLVHFEQDEDATAAEARLDRALATARHVARDVVDDLADGPTLPGQADHDRLQQLRKELDLSPATLRETLECAMAVGAGRPRLKQDSAGRTQLEYPVPAVWRDVVNATLRETDDKSALLSLVFDPDHYVKNASGRPVFIPERDSRLMHLGNALYHRVMAVFAHFRFPGSTHTATRWRATHGAVPAGMDAVLHLTMEELAVNELREPCHHWVRTISMPIRGGVLLDALPHRDPSGWAPTGVASSPSAARAIWDDVEADVKKFLKAHASARTQDLAKRLAAASTIVAETEKKRFAHRRKELTKAMEDNQIAKLAKEADKVREQQKQLSLYAEYDQEQQKRLANLEAEMALRASHFPSVVKLLDAEEQRTLRDVLPLRYALRGEVRVYPVAVELMLPGAP